MKKTVSMLLSFLLIFSFPVSALGVGAWENVRNWKEQHGYDFEFDKSTTADLTPISDYLTILEENGIYLPVYAFSVIHQDNSEWVQSEISSDGMFMRYVAANDGSCYSLSMEIPGIYRPRDDAFALLMVSMLGITREEAEEQLTSLKYNIVDGMAWFDLDGFSLIYAESRYEDGFHALTVRKYVPQQE